jgi:hypothetical protein
VFPRNLGESHQSSRATARSFSEEPAGPIPASVRTAVRLLYAGAIIHAVGLLYYGLSFRPSIEQTLQFEDPNSGAYAETGAAIGGVFLAAVVAGMWLWMAWAIRRGRSWARILCTVLFGVGALLLVGHLVSHPGSPLTLGWALGWLAGLGAVIFMFQSSASAYFSPSDWAPQAAGYPGCAGWQSVTGAPSGPGRHRAKSRRTGPVIGICAAAVVAIVVAGWLAVGGHLGGAGSEVRTDADTFHTRAHTLTMPRAAGGYTRMTGSVGKRIVAGMRQRATKDAGELGDPWKSAYEAAQFGIYVNPSQLRIVFIGFSADRSPEFAYILRSSSRADEFDGFLRGAGVSSTQDFPAGPLGGVMRCGQSPDSFTICAWIDSSVLVMLISSDSTPSTLATVALEFRKVAEH